MESSRRCQKVCAVNISLAKNDCLLSSYWEHQGIKISEPEEVIVEVQELQGAQYGPDGYVQQWSRSYTYYPLQAIVMYRPENALQQHQDEVKTLAELFKKGDICFVLKSESDLYGKQVEVMNTSLTI